MLGCKKTDEPSDPMVVHRDFYTMEREIILSEDFNNYSNDWELYTTSDNDTCVNEVPFIESGILWVHNQCDHQEVDAKWVIPETTSRYLALEVLFNAFRLSMDKGGGFGCCTERLIVQYQGLQMSFGLRSLFDVLSVDYSGHTIHFLIDSKDSGAVYAFTDEFIPIPGQVAGSPDNPGIEDEDISVLVAIEPINSSSNFIHFQSGRAFSQLGYLHGSLSVDMVELYVPKVKTIFQY